LTGKTIDNITHIIYGHNPSINVNLLVYNVKEKTFVEVDENDGVQREIKNENLSDMLTSDPLYVVQTTPSILIIAQNTKVNKRFPQESIVNSTGLFVVNTFRMYAPSGEKSRTTLFVLYGK
jgi:hypothetical protein